MQEANSQGTEAFIEQSLKLFSNSTMIEPLEDPNYLSTGRLDKIGIGEVDLGRMGVQNVVFHRHALSNLDDLRVEHTRLPDVELKQLGSRLITDATDVPKPLGGQQGEAFSLAFQQSTVAGLVISGSTPKKRA